MKEDLRIAAQRIVEENPSITRTELASELGITSDQARHLKDKIGKRIIGPRIATFDLETTSLIGDYATILCGSVLSYPSMDMKTYRLDECKRKDMTDDSNLSVLIRDKLEEHDILMGWFSKGFDVSMLNTRLIAGGNRKLEGMLHYDGCFSYRGWHGLKPRSSKLSVVAEFYDLEDRKMPIDIQVWRSASVGNKEAMDLLVERCESDVWITAQVIERDFRNRLVKNITRYA